MPVETVTNLDEYRVVTIVTSETWRENCYLVSHIPSGEQALIDPGDDPDSLTEAVIHGGDQLRHILLTHAHHDHVGGVAALSRRFGLACEVHKADVRLLRHAPMYAMRFAHKRIEPPEPFQTFEDQPVFRLGSQPIEVLHTPGHTPGSVSYFFRGFVFTGDTLLYQRVGRTDLPGGDASLLAASVSHLMTYLPDNTVLFPGHGGPWAIAEARDWWQNEAGSALPYK